MVPNYYQVHDVGGVPSLVETDELVSDAVLLQTDKRPDVKPVVLAFRMRERLYDHSSSRGVVLRPHAELRVDGLHFAIDCALVEKWADEELCKHVQCFLECIARYFKVVVCVGH